MTTTETKQWLNVLEACEYIGVSKALLYNLMKDSRLPFYYISGTKQRRLKKEDLDALLIVGRPDDEVDDSEIEEK